MRVILYMAVSANGYIARSNGDTPWSQEEWASYFDFVGKMGNLIVGRRTYEIMKETDEFKNLNHPVTMVVSGTLPPKEEDGAIFVSSPEEALKVLENMGFTGALLCGGGMLNASFLEKKLIDEIYLDLEPRIFGRGIRLFADTDADIKLKLLSVKNLSDDVLQLRYKVIK